MNITRARKYCEINRANSCNPGAKLRPMLDLLHLAHDAWDDSTGDQCFLSTSIV